MSRIRSSLVTAAVAGAVLAPAATAQGAPTTLAVEQAPTRVAAWNGVAMWSRFDAATQTYSLVKSVDGGAPTRVAVAPRAGGPFDIDMGTSRSAQTYAVYTRDDGDVYRLNVTTGSEAKVANLSSPTLDERDPTIMRGQIAFIRRERGYDQLRIGDTSADARGSRLLVKRRSIVHAELGTTHVAYLTTGPGPMSDNGSRYMHIRNLRTGADRRVYRAVSGGANWANTTRPTYIADPAAFVWARTNNGSGTGNRIVRYTLRGSQLGYAPGSPRYRSTAWAGDALGAVTSGSLDGETQGACTDGGVNYCQVTLTGPLQFNLRP
ncbi:MAG TPA: hypothetical protein VGV90_01645 [Solirubrobacteraceae bacterium]|nr:hypothetical protein [Solirubrobacteraceae bacterium]